MVKVPRLRFKVRHLMGLVAIVAIGTFMVDASHGIIWDGYFPLEVYLAGTAGQEIAQVAVKSMSHMTYVECFVVEAGKWDASPENVDWKEGEPFTVLVRNSGTVSGCGRELSYSQHDDLIIRIIYKDGTKKEFHTAIPYGRSGPQRVTVDIPQQSHAP